MGSIYVKNNLLAFLSKTSHHAERIVVIRSNYYCFTYMIHSFLNEVSTKSSLSIA